MAKRNGSIDVFRYICAVMVIAIHTSPFYDINEHLGYIATEVLTRIAVPFFFLTSGFFYIKKLNNDKSASKIYLCRLLKTYAVWSCLYYLVDFLEWGHANLKGFLAHCVYTFTVTGSYYHFWFFPALIASICLVTLVYRVGVQKILLPTSIILYIIGCLGCSYSAVGQLIPGLSWLYQSDSFLIIRRIFLMGFPFFTAGMAIEWVKNRIDRMSIRTQVLLLAAVLSWWLLEIAFIKFLGLGDDIIITFGLYLLTVYVFVFLLMHPGSYGKIAAQCNASAEWTYYVHPIVIVGIQGISGIIGIEIENTLMFVLTSLIALALHYIFACLNNWFVCKKGNS